MKRGFACKPTWKNNKSRLGRMFLSLLLSFVIACSVSVVNVSAASGIKIRYNKKTITYTGKQLGVTVDGKKLNLSGIPGIAVKNSKKETIYMVPAYDVFKKGLGASYKSSSGKITISKWGITMKMTVGSKTATVNGKKMTLDYPPTTVKYYGSGKTKVLVPSKNVATTLGYSYSSTSTSSTSATIKMTTPFMVKYDGTWKKYTSTQAKFTMDGNAISVTDMPCISINGNFYVQAKKFADPKIGAKYGFSSTSKVITLKNSDNVVKMTVGSTSATVNGKKATMPTPPKQVTNSKNGVTYIMVPLTFTAGKLGYLYQYNSSNKTCEMFRNDDSYFTWKMPEQNGGGSVESTPGESDSTSGNRITEIYAERQGDSDVVTIYGNFSTNDVTSSTSGTTTTVTFANTSNGIGEKSATIARPFMLKSAKLKQSGAATTLTIGRTSDRVTCTMDKQDGFVQLTLTKISYKIAIDCGHGAYTAGKRTPPILTDLDFDGDGIIDAKKGTTIKEHTANVGVGVYLSKALKRCGFDVYESAFGTEDVPLSGRQSNIKSYGADYSVSIHFNAYGDAKSFNSANGIEVFYHKDKAKAGDSKRFATAILNQVIKGTPQKNRGINGANAFALCNTSAMNTKASILLECAFMTNWLEVRTMMANDAYWRETAEEVARGICDYTGVAYVAG